MKSIFAAFGAPLGPKSSPILSDAGFSALLFDQMNNNGIGLSDHMNQLFADSALFPKRGKEYFRDRLAFSSSFHIF